MREAIADLKLNQQNGDIKPYGHDLVVEEDEATGGSGSDDIWDLISEVEEDEYSSDYIDGAEDPMPQVDGNGFGYGREWLEEKCIAFARGRSGLDPNEVQQQITALLASDSKSKARVCNL